MHELRIGPDWAAQIDAIRDKNTEDTNLIRFDNGFYRMCSGEPGTFEVFLTPGVGRLREGVHLEAQRTDLYVTKVNGQPFQRYASTLDEYSPQASTLDQALHDVHTARGTELFRLQSLIVFCVAESLRSDHVATLLGHTISATMANLKGVPPRLRINELLPVARAWGQSSDAVFRSLSREAQDIVVQPRRSLSVQQRRFCERVDLSNIDPDLRTSAKVIKVLKRPN